MSAPPGDLIDPADESASAAADRAGVRISALETTEDLGAGVDLLDTIWSPNGSGLSAITLRALAHAGNYAYGAYMSGNLCGVSVGFFGDPVGTSLHSHITGVLDSHMGKGIGRAMKLHQRAWALRRRLSEITWTFDPLIARNAYFNLSILGAKPAEYLPDFYGHDRSRPSTAEPSDRLLTRWDLTAEARTEHRSVEKLVSAGALVVLDESETGSPVGTAKDISGSNTLLIRVPDDFEGLRLRSPDAASEWRCELRQILLPRMSSGEWVIDGFLKEGCYVIKASERSSSRSTKATGRKTPQSDHELGPLPDPG